MIAGRFPSDEVVGHWPGRVIYHGTSAAAAKDIRASGVDITKCTPGYFGVGFYLAEDEDLARNNYADWREPGEPPGEVLAVRVRRMVAAGVDGIFDRSFGGLCIYNTKSIELVSR